MRVRDVSESRTRARALNNSVRMQGDLHGFKFGKSHTWILVLEDDGSAEIWMGKMVPIHVVCPC